MFREDDIELLQRPLFAMLTVAPGEGRWPAPRPVWFELAGDGTLQMFTTPEAPKLARLRATPRASVLVSAPVGEPEHWVAVVGAVTLHEDGAADLAARMAARYWDMSDPARGAALDAWQSAAMVRFVLHPESIQRFAF